MTPIRAAVPLRRAGSAPPRRARRPAVPRAAPPERDSLESLSSLLGDEGEAERGGGGDVPWASLPNRGNAPRRDPKIAADDLLEEDRGMPRWFAESQSGRAGRSVPDSEPLDVPTYPPALAYGAVAACLAVHAAGVAVALTQGDEASNDFFLALAQDPAAVLDRGEYYRLLSSTFVHAGLLHLGLNSVALWQVGAEVEACMGGPTFAAVYLLSGLAGSTASLLASDLVTVGASGAVFGLLGALGGYFARNRELENSARQLLFLGALASFNFLLGAQPDSQVDNAGHVGGLLAGAWLGYAMGPRFRVVKELEIREGSMEVPRDGEARELRVVVDQSSALGKAAVGASFALSLALAVALAVALRREGLP